MKYEKVHGSNVSEHLLIFYSIYFNYKTTVKSR